MPKCLTDQLQRPVFIPSDIGEVAPEHMWRQLDPRLCRHSKEHIINAFQQHGLACRCSRNIDKQQRLVLEQLSVFTHIPEAGS